MRYHLDQVSSYKQTLLDAIVAISTSDAPVLHDICNLQEIYYLIEAVERQQLMQHAKKAA
jgi:hypothetical protein